MPVQRLKLLLVNDLEELVDHTRNSWNLVVAWLRRMELLQQTLKNAGYLAIAGEFSPDEDADDRW